MKTLFETNRLAQNTLKKCAICLSIAFLPIGLSAQTEGAVRLKWKIAPQETLVYTTLMGESADSTKKADELFLSQLMVLTDESKDDIIHLSKLYLNENGSIGVTVGLHKTEKGKAATRAVHEESFKQLSQKEKEKKSAVVNTDSLLEDVLQEIDEDYVVLEGALDTEGGIKSFYLDKTQKNDLALLFELPSKSVKVGDTWALEVQFTTIIGGFVCDTVVKKNQVKLMGIKQQGQDTIAVLGYDIQEFVSGTVSYSKDKIVYQTTYNALAEFSVSKGRWLNYNGKMVQKITGIYTDTEPDVRRYALVPRSQ